MNTDVFIFNSTASHLDIQDAIYERIGKLKAFTNCFMLSSINSSEVDLEATSSLLDAMHDLLEEIEFLFKQITATK